MNTRKRLVPFLPLILGFLSIAAAWRAPAQSFDAVSQGAHERLEASVQRFAELQVAIREEKIPISRQVQRLQEEVREIRRNAERIERLSASSAGSLAALREESKVRRENVDFAINLLAEYARSLETRADVSEWPLYDSLIQKAMAANDDPDLTDEEKIAALMEVADSGVKRLAGLIGGDRFEGASIMPNGDFEEGWFGLFGPITFFSTYDGEAGLVESSRSLQPALIRVAEGAYDSGIFSFVKGETATIPLDPTLGNALAIAATKETIMEHIAKGGIWIVPILLFAFVSLIVALFKLYDIFSIPKPKPASVHQLLDLIDEEKREEAIRQASELPGPIGRMLELGVRKAKEDPEVIEEMFYGEIMKTQPRVERLLPIISVTAAVAPLLGLLGTVTGMINTFKMITVFGTGDAKSLSSGISEALVTTEFGLIVAIPSLILYALLSRSARGFLAEMDRNAIAFVNGLKSGGGEKGERAA